MCPRASSDCCLRSYHVRVKAHSEMWKAHMVRADSSLVRYTHTHHRASLPPTPPPPLFTPPSPPQPSTPSGSDDSGLGLGLGLGVGLGALVLVGVAFYLSRGERAQVQTA